MLKFDELISGEKPVLVDFSAEWCEPCKMMVPQLQELSSRINEKAKIIKVDIDKNPRAASSYNIRGVPTFILFKKGQIVWRQSGMLSAVMLEQVINQYA